MKPPLAVADLTLEDLPNIKPISVSRLKRIGIESVLELATAIPQEIVNESGESLDIAIALVIEVRNALSNIGLLSKEFCLS